MLTIINSVKAIVYLGTFTTTFATLNHVSDEFKSSIPDVTSLEKYLPEIVVEYTPLASFCASTAIFATKAYIAHEVAINVVSSFDVGMKTINAAVAVAANIGTIVHLITNPLEIMEHLPNIMPLMQLNGSGDSPSIFTEIYDTINYIMFDPLDGY